MSAGLGDAMQIIEIISAVRKVYKRIQGTGKEIDDAFRDVEMMESELNFLQNTFSPKKSGSYPEIVSAITTQFKPLRKSMKQLRRLFEQYLKFSKNLVGKAFWAYNKRRDELHEIQFRFVTYRSIFQRSLLLLNEGHNNDQAKMAKEIKEQARRYEKERKEDDKARKKQEKKQAKELKDIKDIVQKLQKREEEKSVAEKIMTEDDIEGWLVKQKGLDPQEAKTFLKALAEKKEPKKKVKPPKAAIPSEKDETDTKKPEKKTPVTTLHQNPKPDKNKSAEKTANDAKPSRKPKVPVIITQDTDAKVNGDVGRKTVPNKEKLPKEGHRRSRLEEQLSVPEKPRPRAKSESTVESTAAKRDNKRDKSDGRVKDSSSSIVSKEEEHRRVYSLTEANLKTATAELHESQVGNSQESLAIPEKKKARSQSVSEGAKWERERPGSLLTAANLEAASEISRGKQKAGRSRESLAVPETKKPRSQSELGVRDKVKRESENKEAKQKKNTAKTDSSKDDKKRGEVSEETSSLKVSEEAKMKSKAGKSQESLSVPEKKKRRSQSESRVGDKEKEEQAKKDEWRKAIEGVYKDVDKGVEAHGKKDGTHERKGRDAGVKAKSRKERDISQETEGGRNDSEKERGALSDVKGKDESTKEAKGKSDAKSEDLKSKSKDKNGNPTKDKNESQESKTKGQDKPRGIKFTHPDSEEVKAKLQESQKRVNERKKHRDESQESKHKTDTKKD